MLHNGDWVITKKDARNAYSGESIPSNTLVKINDAVPNFGKFVFILYNGNRLPIFRKYLKEL